MATQRTHAWTVDCSSQEENRFFIRHANGSESGNQMTLIGEVYSYGTALRIVEDHNKHRSVCCQQCGEPFDPYWKKGDNRFRDDGGANPPPVQGDCEVCQNKDLGFID